MPDAAERRVLHGAGGAWRAGRVSRVSGGRPSPAEGGGSRGFSQAGSRLVSALVRGRGGIAEVNRSGLMRRYLCAGVLFFWAGLASSQQMAVTFDDLPVHGAMPPGMTRLEIAQPILQKLKREKLPAVYGFINGGRGADDPSSLSVLQAWRGARQPVGDPTWAH